MTDMAGLMRVPFTTTATAHGVYNVVVNTTQIGTELADSSGNPINFSVANGTITVVVPEPPTLCCLATASALVFLGLLQRRFGH
jgi:hypothetical protein